MFKLSAIAFSALLPLSMFAQETITLRDGTQYTGRMTAATATGISFRDSTGVLRRFDVGQIDTLRFYDNRTSYNNNDPVRGSYNPSGNNGNGNSDFAGRGYNSAPRRNYMTLDSGTEIVVRTNERINSEDTNNDRFYSAQVNRDVLDRGGNVIIPRGSDAELVVRRLSNNTLSLDLQSVSVNGQRFNVDTADITATGSGRQGVGENKRTAEYVGGGAVLGTLLGAIAGGGKGAAIGALAGGAAGAGAQVLTRGSQVKVPSESELSFRLDSPMTLRY